MAIIDETELGFDLDEETVKLFDAILVNIATDPELKEEFKKLKFIKALENKHNDAKGPIQQLLEKVALIEKDRFEGNMDLRRVIADMEHLAKVVQQTLPPENKEQLRGIHEVKKNMKYYTYQGK